MSEDRNPTRLPPPAFPPGARRHQTGSTPEHDGSGAATVPGDGTGDVEAALGGPPRSPADSFQLISPDEPLPDRRRAVEEGTVTGLGDDPHLGPEDLAAGGDPYVRELTTTVAKLAEALRSRGEAGLKTTPDMTRFEATLRAYCVGFLAGRRAEESAE